MGSWDSVVSALAVPLDQSGALLARMPIAVAVVLLAVPLVATLLSMRLTLICAVSVLLGVIVAVLVAPAAAPGITAIAAYFGCLLLAVQAIQHWRGARAESAELAELRAIVTKIQDAESRRFLMELTSSKPSEEVDQSALAASPRLEARAKPMG